MHESVRSTTRLQQVALPDGTILKARLYDGTSKTIGGLLEAVLHQNEKRIKKRAQLSSIRYSEWRLTCVPHFPEKNRWTKRDLAVLYKPLDATLELTDNDNGLLLFNVLANLPVRLLNLPHVPSTNICVPILSSMSVETLNKTIMDTLHPPIQDERGQRISYSLKALPDIAHTSIDSISAIEFTSDVQSVSWLKNSLSRPASYFGSWVASIDESAPSSSLKDKISEPRPVTPPALIPVSSDPTKLKETATDDVEFLAFLEDLGIPDAKRETLRGLPPEKRLSLLALEKGSLRLGNGSRAAQHDRAFLSGSFHTVALEERVGEPQTRTAESTENTQEQVVMTDRGRQHSISGRKQRPSKSCSRSRSPIRINMSICPPRFEWTAPRSPVKAQGTGSSWLSSWWTKSEAEENQTDPQSYITSLKIPNSSFAAIAQELIRLRVQLSTIRASWITDFVALHGIDVLADLNIKDIEDSSCKLVIQAELLKIFRILLNVRVSFTYILLHKACIHGICSIARNCAETVQILAFDLLGGLCISSPDMHRTILTALCKEWAECSDGRYIWLNNILRRYQNVKHVSDLPITTDLEHLRSCLTLISVLTSNCSVLEERYFLRNELLGDLDVCKMSVSQNIYGEEVKIQLDLLRMAIEDDTQLLRSMLLTSLGKPEVLIAKEDEERPSVEEQLSEMNTVTPVPISDPSSMPTLESLQAEIVQLKMTISRLQAPDHNSKSCKIVNPNSHEVIQSTDLNESPEVAFIAEDVLDLKSSDDFGYSFDLNLFLPEQALTLVGVRALCDEQSDTVAHLLTTDLPAVKKENTAMITSERIGRVQRRSAPQGSNTGDHVRVLSDVTECSSRVISGTQSLYECGSLESLAEGIVTTKTSLDESKHTETTTTKHVEDSCEALSSLVPLPAFVIPPPPPPLPTSAGLKHLRATTTKTIVAKDPPRARKKLKPLFWDKMDASKISNTIWLQLHEREDNDFQQGLMLTDFERFFCQEFHAPKSTLQPVRHQIGITRITLIDLQRAKNIEVMLSRMRCANEDVRKALLTVDNALFGSTDQWKLMLRNLPTAEEMQLVREFQGDLATLGQAEQYIRALDGIPLLEQRLQAIIYSREFDLEAAELEPDLASLASACQEARHCKDLQGFLALSLSAGNILNATTFRGKAIGFKLESLMKLGEVRSIAREKSGATLLHYLVAITEKRLRSGFATVLREKLKYCCSASRICSSNTFATANSLIGGLDAIKKAIAEDSDASADQFQTRMSIFVNKVESSVETIQHRLATVESSCSQVLAFYGEDPDVQIEHLFTTLKTFIELVENASEENARLSGNHILLTKVADVPASPKKHLRTSSFEGTLRAIREGRHGRESSLAKDRPPSRVFSFQ